MLTLRRPNVIICCCVWGLELRYNIMCDLDIWRNQGGASYGLTTNPPSTLPLWLRSPSQTTLLIKGNRRSSCSSLSNGFSPLPACRIIQTSQSYPCGSLGTLYLPPCYYEACFLLPLLVHSVPGHCPRWPCILICWTNKLLLSSIVLCPVSCVRLSHSFGRGSPSLSMGWSRDSQSSCMWIWGLMNLGEVGGTEARRTRFHVNLKITFPHTLHLL